MEDPISNYHRIPANGLESSLDLPIQAKLGVELGKVQETPACEFSQRKLFDVNSGPFNMIVGGVIVINATVIGFETDYSEDGFLPLEYIFSMCFLMEMVMRMHQTSIRKYFKDPKNVFDCFLVNLSIFDLYIVPMLGMAKKDMFDMKTLRLLRIFRILRLVRIFRMFRELGLILDAFFKAFRSIMWVGVLTLVINYIFAVFATQIIGRNASEWGEDEDKISQWFGCVPYSMRTLFFIMTLASWDDIVLTISKQFNGFIVLGVAMFYIVLMAFSMVSLITGILSDAVITAQTNSEERKREEIEFGKKVFAEAVKDLFTLVDKDGSGTVNREEVKHALKYSKSDMQKDLAFIGLNPNDLTDLVDQLADETGDAEVSIEKIADAIVRQSGTAKAYTLWEVKHMILENRTESSKVTHTLQVQVGEITKHVNHLELSMVNMETKLALLCKHLLPVAAVPLTVTNNRSAILGQSMAMNSPGVAMNSWIAGKAQVARANALRM